MSKKGICTYHLHLERTAHFEAFAFLGKIVDKTYIHKSTLKRNEPLKYKPIPLKLINTHRIQQSEHNALIEL